MRQSSDADRDRDGKTGNEPMRAKLKSDLIRLRRHGDPTVERQAETAELKTDKKLSPEVAAFAVFLAFVALRIFGCS
jgi:hypothetical protein